MDVCNLISYSSTFSKTILNIWNFTVHVLLKPGLENFEHYFTSVWNECNCAIVWAFLGIAFLWDWNENWSLPVSLYGISNFLEGISRHSHSTVFLYFFALIAEEGFLISPCYSLELCIQMGISFLFSFAFRCSHQEASISLLPFSIRGQTEWKPQSQKTNQSDYMDHSVV